ncbi:MAG TPA: hypothetical protein VLG50_05105 [Candidatus Saccharimonadales bacterium]|nr:hypothetical protein [Candidatus Saccharimonadales bacterium]
MITLYGQIAEDNIFPSLSYAIKYTDSKTHTLLNLTTTSRDPLIILKFYKQTGEYVFQKMIPLKYCQFCDDGSILSSNKRLLDGFLMTVQLVCKRNEKLDKHCFKKQLEKQIIKFNQRQSIGDHILYGSDINSLISDDVINDIGDMFIEINNTRTTSKIYSHGQNGIINVKQLIESSMRDHVPASMSVFDYIKRRERGFKNDQFLKNK